MRGEFVSRAFFAPRVPRSFGAVPRFPRRRCECYRTIISSDVSLMRLAVDACYQ